MHVLAAACGVNSLKRLILDAGIKALNENISKKQKPGGELFTSGLSLHKNIFRRFHMSTRLNNDYIIH